MKPLNRIPILCTVSILYLFIIGRNLSTKQTLAAARHAGRGECEQVPPWSHMERHQDITPETPSLPLLALHMLACAHLGNAGPGGYLIAYAARQVSDR